MDFSVIVSIVIAIFAIAFYKAMNKRRSIPKGLKELPTERGLPLIGMVNKLGDSFLFYLTGLIKKHGPLFAVRLGMRNVVYLNNYDMVAKALRDNGNVFAGRFEVQYKKDVCHESGILFRDGDIWSKQKAFILSVFQDFGFGSSKSQTIVQDECSNLLEELSTINGSVVDFSHFISIYMINIFSKFMMNKRFDRDSKEVILIHQIMSAHIKATDKMELLGIMYPFLDKSPLFTKIIKTFTNNFRVYEKAYSNFQDEINRHLKNLNLNSQGEDFMDKFLIEQHRLREKNGKVDTFTDWQLIMNSYDLFIAGYETISTQLVWSCMFMSKFPDVQERVHREIVEKVGTNRMVTMNDKTSLDYTQAVIDEIMRMSSIGPVGLPHKTLQDTNIDGYYIPKNSLVFGNIFACHYDPDVWDKPKQFNPDRFISKNSNGELKYTPRKEMIAFGIGKRRCIGESLARTEFFTIFTNIFQKFQIRPSEDISEKRYDECLRIDCFLIRDCLIKEFIFKSRS